MTPISRCCWAPGDPVNGAKVLALIDGAEADDAEIAAMERVWVLFDGNDAAATASRARRSGRR